MTMRPNPLVLAFICNATNPLMVELGAVGVFSSKSETSGAHEGMEAYFLYPTISELLSASSPNRAGFDH